LPERQRVADWQRAIPTVLTLLRLAAVPVVAILWLRRMLPSALIVYVFMAASDLIDGWLARRLDAVSRVGAWLDPLVDIIVVLALLGVLVSDGALPIWTPIAPALAAIAFLWSSCERPRYGIVGRYYGAVLYVAVGMAMVRLPGATQIVIAAAVTAWGVVAMAERLSAVSSTHAKP